MPYHWSSRYGRSGKYVGTLYLKLLDDNQHMKALVMAVAEGHRACVQIHDGNFHDKYWTKDMDTGKEYAQLFFNN